MKPGDAVTWRHVPRGGYGYIAYVAAFVVRVNPKRVAIEVPLLGAGRRIVNVRPENLTPRGAP